MLWAGVLDKVQTATGLFRGAGLVRRSGEGVGHGVRERGVGGGVHGAGGDVV